jgi:hypothetical protein
MLMETVYGMAFAWKAHIAGGLPSYWFSGKYPATCGSNVEQGDNEQIPTWRA